MRNLQLRDMADNPWTVLKSPTSSTQFFFFQNELLLSAFLWSSKILAQNGIIILHMWRAFTMFLYTVSFQWSFLIKRFATTRYRAEEWLIRIQLRTTLISKWQILETTIQFSAIAVIHQLLLSYYWCHLSPSIPLQECFIKSYVCNWQLRNMYQDHTNQNINLSRDWLHYIGVL